MSKEELYFKDDGINKIPFELAVRLEGFINLGIPREQLMDVITRTAAKTKPGTEEWSQVILSAADNFAEKAKECETDWLHALFWYFLARFPHYFNNTMKKAYIKHKNAYLKASSFSKYPIEKMVIPFQNQGVVTYLRKPATKRTSLPLVIIWGGIDIWKSDMQIHQIGNALLEKGIAVLAIDGPGTGECPVPISTSSDNWFLAVLDAIKERKDINFDKIACYGLSFGGYWATKLAIQLPWLAGAVNVGGPVHHTFNPDWIKQLPDSTYNTLTYSCGFNRFQNSDLMYFANLSLAKQGLLPAESNAPLLIINGAKDNLVTIAEMDFLNTQGVEGDTLVFANDRHVASQNWKIHSQLTINWLEMKLQ
ncbi:alpha/beta fold hydrolase [Legionella micdadei]|uniref:alpha/beta fold hydrolase n=1 Tax=Legionella micdadei TaxID=451 RepID=UPI0009EF7FD5|nr:alpha/beta fold hydrolase [Legionella micdadei]ARH00657.1 hypothetical protein B6V88_09640 [Legionella micdadei]